MKAQSSKFTIQAPAKLNLGLEVLGRRSDGFHEIATIFTTVDLNDTLFFRTLAEPRLLCETPGVSGHDDLVLKALQKLQPYCQAEGGLQVTVTKRIPTAAGLGGASSDAAAALIAANELWNVGLRATEIRDVAAQLGSDVPFFVDGGGAYATGRGDVLQPLNVPPGLRFVIVSPIISMSRKTARLYASLQAQDFSDGARVRAQANRLLAGDPMDPDLLGNAFARPLYDRFPQLAELPALIREAGATLVALSGAGPTHFTVVDDDSVARQIASELRQRLHNDARVFVAAPAPPRYYGQRVGRSPLDGRT